MALRIQSWLALGLSVVLLGLVIGNIVLVLGNVDQQEEVNRQQASIQQAEQVELPLYRELTQALAELAVRGDAQIANLLKEQGIQVTAQPAPETQQAPAPVAQPEPGRAKGKPPASKP